MGLSDSHAEKWRLLKRTALAVRDEESLPVDSVSQCKAVTKLKQHQKRLDDGEIEELAVAYRAGSTVYELAKQFGCHRTTISGCLHRQGIQMRRLPLTEDQVNEAERLYLAGHSLALVSEKVGANASTVRSRLLKRGVAMRPPHAEYISCRPGCVLSYPAKST